MYTIKVPATSANLGPGFDSFGLALSLYLTLEVGEEAEQWEIQHALGEEIPTDESNLIIKTAISVFPNIQPRKLRMSSDIPPARGLGSSSAAIVAGIELANKEGQLALTPDEKVQLATKIEGHPDNVLPAILGDFTVGAMLEGQVLWSRLPFPEIGILATIPDRPLLTQASRSVLPASLPYADAIEGSGAANMLLAAVSEQNPVRIGYLMEKDIFHEPYRSALIPELNNIRTIGQEIGAYGSCLSGAGTTILTVAPFAKLEQLQQRIEQELPQTKVQQLLIDRQGVVTV